MKALKKAVTILLTVSFLSGCAGQNRDLERGIELRTQLLGSSGCSFDADITADYGDKVYSFSLQCQADDGGNLRFTVTKPDSIAGIQGSVDGTDGALTFDGIALPFWRTISSLPLVPPGC